MYLRDREKILSYAAKRYKRLREAAGFKVKSLRGKPRLTPEQKARHLKRSQQKYINKNRHELRAKWRTFALRKKEDARRNDPKAYAKMIQAKADYDKMYRKRERKKRRKWDRAYVQRKRDDVSYHIGRRIRARIRMAIRLNGGRKAAKSTDLLGCTIAQARSHLESQFVGAMGWERFMRGEIHIDHIIPCNSFDLRDPVQQRQCFHWTNIRPMWAADNLKKGYKTLPIESLTRLE